MMVPIVSTLAIPDQIRSTSTRIKGMLPVAHINATFSSFYCRWKRPRNALDVLFLQDFTGSQGSYIDQSRREINEVCNSLLRLNEGELVAEDLRFGLIAFRDHPPQDKTFVSKIFDFTSDASIMASYLGSLTVEGGGDGPEAQCDALFDALHSPWNERATKVAVLVTDAPPHGLGESDDGFPDGCPCGHDPLQIADGMLSSGITLYVIACEPTLSTSYQHARHFYEGLTRKTGGQVYNLGNPSGLTDVIVGCLLQATDSDTLVARHRAAIRRDAASGALSPEEIARTLHEDLSNANVSHYGLSLDAMVELNEEGERNIQEWYDATSMIAARENIREAPPNRIKPEYLSGSSPAASMGRRPITLAQVEGIVRRSLSRRH
ncbi:von willebrand factor type A domain protein [Rhizoctonia solani AG-3 Rhs1AP]|uniref:von willebrand factor type A domain protein n=1 Tax=Rhizoctonia solani AG-3 Rhs1AP TaxID=1086054 RepID=X8JHU4_9AGAM|nr:von willebrand factor type A domain protein [Rhizoctonia solani AG-3 Rhs1AP]